MKLVFLGRDSKVADKQAFQNLSLIKEPYDESDFITAIEQLTFLTFSCTRTCKQLAVMLVAMSKKVPVLFIFKVLQKKQQRSYCIS